MSQEAIITVAPMFGVLDITILVGAATFGVFWLVKKKFESSSSPPPENSFKIETRLTSMHSDDRSFISKMKNQNRNIVVFYGSQTGTAEEFANRLAKEAARYGMKAMVADPEEYDMEELVKLGEIENSVAVFCLATYGEGDPTDNSIEFNEWLQNGEVDLSCLNYAVFGLGNKTYEHYNAMGKFVDKRVEELGGRRVVELGLGDDDANIEEDFVTWKEKFWPAVMDFFNLEFKLQDISMRQYKLVSPPMDLPQEKIFKGEIARLRSFTNQRPPFDAKNPYLATVKAWKELFKGGDRSCMHIEMDTSGSKLRYDSGDHVAIYPVNDSELVQKFGDLLNIDLDTLFSLQNIDEDSTKKSPFPVPCTYRTALSHYVDITACPRTHVIKEIADYATNQEDKEKLLLLASNNPEGKAYYQKFVLDDCRSLLHILEDFPSCKPPLDMVCELLPRLQARFYSISSSPKVHPTAVHVTAVVVRYTTPTGRINKGVATTWLSSKKPEDGVVHTVPCYIRKSQFRLPPRVQTPIIMIGPGTGIAPFRGFLQERAFLKSEGRPVGENVLYFGCRKKDHDFLYEEELNSYVQDGVLKLRVAFSREQAQKVYVQHLLKEDAKDVWRIIGQENGHLYLCGDAKNMAREVLETLILIIQTEGNMSEADARSFIKKMEGQRRYATDVWS